MATSSGIPCCANMWFKVFTIDTKVVLFNLAISINALTCNKQQVTSLKRLTQT